MTSTSIPVADEFEQRPYLDLAERIERQTDTIYPAHGGGYSDVYIGHVTEENQNRIKVAIKVLRIDNDPNNVEKIRRYLNRETWVWHRLKHPNILPFLGLASNCGRWGVPALVSPYCDNDILPHYLKGNPDTDRMMMIKGVASGLGYLHRMNVVHGDMKPSNVLVDVSGNPLLCDFGRSKILNQRGFTTKPAGAARYQAVELLSAEHGDATSPTQASDVYAFGLSCSEVWTGLMPYHLYINEANIVINVVMKAARPPYPNPAPPGTDKLWPILVNCWESEPEKRPSMLDVLQRLS